MRKELSLFTVADILHHFPFRHIDKTKIDNIRDLNPAMEFAQVKVVLLSLNIAGSGRAKRLVGLFRDSTGIMEMVWFQGITWVEKFLRIGTTYLAYGKPGFFLGKPQMAHPELETVSLESGLKKFLEPVYPSTEKLKARGISGKIFSQFVDDVFNKISSADLPEILPEEIIKKYKLSGRFEALKNMHFPPTIKEFNSAVRRIKFEELFLAQLHIQILKQHRKLFSKGWVFEKVGNYFNSFYNNHLPFDLTGAQKKVIKEIRSDLISGKQMNRLLQGDVGSGKTIVALLCMLLAADNGFQSILMAPTEILAIQHFNAIAELTEGININVKLLTGSVKAKERKKILDEAASGDLNILVGTHAVIEDKVQMKNIGFAVIDEQHKFGVAQRAALWKKNVIPPHVLVMTATPIPRTLALTAYGDLDYSVLDELPPGRKPVTTIHRHESARSQIMDFIKSQIKEGRQAYLIYPLIEESSKLDYENLMKGYEEVKSYFPEPKYWISMVHGKMTPELKETNMQRFVENDTHIMVGTTVIEVGINVPNATVMVIESAEKFGLSQLHQLRGRVGRGAEQSYCILLSGQKVSQEAKERLGIMVETNDGFKIAEKDLELRGPGDIQGTRQSGTINFKLANILADRIILETARDEVENILKIDPTLESAEHLPLKIYLDNFKKNSDWSKIS